MTKRTRCCVLFLCVTGCAARPNSTARRDVAPERSAHADTSTTAHPPRATTRQWAVIGPRVGEQLPVLTARHYESDWALGGLSAGAGVLVVCPVEGDAADKARPAAVGELVRAVQGKFGTKADVTVVLTGPDADERAVGVVAGGFTPQTDGDRPNVYLDAPAGQAARLLGPGVRVFVLDDRRGVHYRADEFDVPALTAFLDQWTKRPRDPSLDLKAMNASTAAAAARAGMTGVEFRDRFFEQADARQPLEIFRRAPELVNHVEYWWSKPVTPLHKAVEDENLTRARWLLDHGANVNGSRPGGNTPLHAAARVGDGKMVELLLSYGADATRTITTNAGLPTGETPARTALSTGHIALAKRLLELPGVPRDFYVDVALGDTAAVGRAIAADPTIVYRPDGFGVTPIDYAVACDRVDVLKQLIAAGVAGDSLGELSGSFPLNTAVDGGRIEMVRLMLQAGASPSVDDDSHAPLVTAVANDDDDIATLLLAAGADVNADGDYSMNALLTAVDRGNAPMVERLLQAGADVNAKSSGRTGHGVEINDCDQQSALHVVADTGRLDIARQLIAAGARADARDEFNRTALSNVVTAPSPQDAAEMTELFVKVGMPWATEDDEGENFLDALRMDIEVAKLARDERLLARLKAIEAKLLELGAKPGSGMSTEEKEEAARKGVVG